MSQKKETPIRSIIIVWNEWKKSIFVLIKRKWNFKINFSLAQNAFFSLTEMVCFDHLIFLFGCVCVCVYRPLSTHTAWMIFMAIHLKFIPKESKNIRIYFGKIVFFFLFRIKYSLSWTNNHVAFVLLNIT